MKEKEQTILLKLLRYSMAGLMVLFISCANPENVPDGEEFEEEASALLDDEAFEQEFSQEGDEEVAMLDDNEGEDIYDLEEGDGEYAESEGEEAYEEEYAESEEGEGEEDGDEEFAEFSEEGEFEEDSEEYAESEDEFEGEEGDELAALEDGDEFGEEAGLEENVLASSSSDVDELEQELMSLEEGNSADTLEPVGSQEIAQTTTPVEESMTEFLEEVPTVGNVPETSFDLAPVVAKPVRKAYRRSVVPEIPNQAVSKNGALLNRFYFVRRGDSPRSVASLLYADESKAAELQDWNGAQWQPGEVLYYVSPETPEDSQMRSFYQARQVPPDAAQIEPGQWLSSIAKRTYGDGRSWKEIAVVNGIRKPDSIKRGQQLALYPRDLSAYSAELVFKKPEPEPQMEVAQNTAPMDEQPLMETTPEMPEKVQMEALPEPEPIPEPETRLEPPREEPAVQKPQAQPTGGIGKLIEKNMFVIAMVGVIALLLLTLSVVKKKKRTSRRENFDEGEFQQKSKSRKRS